MRVFSAFRAFAVGLGCVGCCLPQAVGASPPAAERHTKSLAESPVRSLEAPTLDVQLQAGGTLSGVFTEPDRQPLSGAAVRLSQNYAPVATAVTDAQGQFSVSGLRGGVYEVQAGSEVVLVRCWAPGTAPPHAAAQLDVQRAVLIRGQSPLAASLGNPWIIVGITVAAIAIPVALNNHNDDRTASGN